MNDDSLTLLAHLHDPALDGAPPALPSITSLSPENGAGLHLYVPP